MTVQAARPDGGLSAEHLDEKCKMCYNYNERRIVTLASYPGKEPDMNSFHNIGDPIDIRSVSMQSNRVRIRMVWMVLLDVLVVVLSFLLIPFHELLSKAPLPEFVILILEWLSDYSILGVILLAGLFLFARPSLEYQLTIDETGVTRRFLAIQRYLSWRQIHDFGVSYVGLGFVLLYFSQERLETNANGRKLMFGSRCTILIPPWDLKHVGPIMTFCRQYTRIRPFLCTEEGRLVGMIRDR